MSGLSVSDRVDCDESHVPCPLWALNVSGITSCDWRRCHSVQGESSPG